MAKHNPKKFRKSVTIKEYKVKYQGYDLVIPVGSVVSNRTAKGYDNNYRFWCSFHKQIEAITGQKDSMLSHDLNYYGLNIPAEYCKPYNP